jgi:hypothetical protein
MSDYGRGSEYGGFMPPTPGGGNGAGGYNPPPTIRFEIIGEAWSQFQQQMGTWVLTTLVFMVIVMVLEIIGNMITGTGQPFAAAAPMDPHDMPAKLGGRLLMSLCMNLVGAYLNAGFYGMALKQLRGEAIGIGDLFGGGSAFLPLFLFQLLIGLVIAVPVGVCMVPLVMVAIAQHQPAMIGLGVLIAILVSMVVMGGLMLGQMIIVDRRETNPIAAITASWAALKSNLLSAALFYFVLTLVAMLGFLGCGIGILFTLPLLPLGLALLYRDFFGLPTQNAGYPEGYPAGTAQPWANPPSGYNPQGGGYPQPGAFPPPPASPPSAPYSPPGGYTPPGPYNPSPAPPQQDRPGDPPGAR